VYHIVAKKYKANQGTSYLSKMFITGLFYTGILYDNRPGHHFRSSGFHFSTVSALRCTECGGPTTDPVGNGGSALHACVPHEKKSLNPQTQIHGFYMVLPLALRSILAGLGRLCIGSHLAIVRNSLKSWVWPKPNSGNLMTLISYHQWWWWWSTFRDEDMFNDGPPRHSTVGKMW
jgi:hypothetical protein